MYLNIFSGQTDSPVIEKGTTGICMKSTVKKYTAGKFRRAYQKNIHFANPWQ